MKQVPWTLRLLGILTLLAALMVGGSGSSQAQGNSRTFPETGQTVSGTFLQYWNAHGGLPQQGYPISPEMQEKSDLNGQTYTVQYFERAVFEKHPENQPPYDVLLSQLGTFRYKAKYGDAGAPGQQASTVNARYFPETKHSLGGKFRTYWEQHGGLAQQGYPISDEFQEKSDLNGQTYTVQYFERAVFELHPENQPPYDVLLSQLGTFQYRAKYQASPGATPVPTQPAGSNPCADTPASKDATVTPNCGTVNDNFAITINGFAANEGISFWVTAPNGSVAGTVAPLQVGSHGSTLNDSFRGSDFAQLATLVHSAVEGVWAITYQGQSSQHQSIAYIKIVGAAPAPTAPPSSGCDAPASKDATVTPACGTTSSTFAITITGFSANEGISFWVTAPNGSVAGTAAPLQVGSHGSTLNDSFRGSDFVQLASLVHSPVAGVWAVTYQGSSSQHQSIVYIKIQQ